MARSPKQQFASLRRSIDVLEKRFLKEYLAPVPLTVSRAEHIGVSAYLVLAHAAFEGHLETVAQWVLERAVHNWTTKRRISRATACLLLGAKRDPKDDGKSTFDRIRCALDEAKVGLSRLITADNHGISIEHLRDLFNPLGVDLPQDATLLSSLDRLTTLRGEKAHKGIGATVILSAGDAKQVVSDCLTLSERVTTAAVAVKP